MRTAFAPVDELPGILGRVGIAAGPLSPLSGEFEDVTPQGSQGRCLGGIEPESQELSSVAQMPCTLPSGVWEREITSARPRLTAGTDQTAGVRPHRQCHARLSAKPDLSRTKVPAKGCGFPKRVNLMISFDPAGILLWPGGPAAGVRTTALDKS